MSGSGWFNQRGRSIEFHRPVQQTSPPNPWFMEDFLGDTLDANKWLLTQSGTPTAAGAMSATAGDPKAGIGGWFAGATDDVDAEADELAFDTTATTGAFRADAITQSGGLLICEWGLTVPTALTTRQYFAGLTDDATEGSGAIAIIVTTTTVTDTATDAAGWVFGSAATDNTHWLAVSTDSNSESTITAGPTAAFDTWVGLRTEVDVLGDCHMAARSVRGGKATYYGTTSTGTSPDVQLIPYFAASPTTTTAVPWELDYMFVSQAL